MSPARPRVLVTRPRADGNTLARRLAALGCEAVLAPVLAVVPLAATEPAEAPDALVATSANAFAAPLPPAWLNLPLYAVGGATAAAARAAGCHTVVDAGGDAAALAATLLRDTSAAVRLLLLAGRPRKPELERALAQAGRAPRVLERYKAQAVGWTEAVATELRRSPPAAALHFSRRSAALATAEASRAGLAEPFAAMHHVCLSADVAAALPHRPGSGPIVAMRPDADSLLQALAATLGIV